MALAVWLLIVALAGGVLIDVPPQEWWAVALSAAVLGILARGRTARMLLASACLALTMSYGAGAREHVLHAPLVSALGEALDDRQAPPIWLRGVLLEDAAMSTDGIRLDVHVLAMRRSLTWEATDGRAQLVVGGALGGPLVSEWRRGRTVILPAIVRRPPVWRNPGGSSEDWQRLRRAVDVIGSVKSATMVAVWPGSRASEIFAAIRASTRQRVAQTVGPWSRESAAIVTALLIGDRTGLDDGMIRTLQMAGTYHVIAISGGNIAILVVVTVTMLRIFLRGSRLAAAIALAVVLAYGAVVGDQASVSRAVMAAAVVLGLDVVGWCAHPLRIFGCAALLVMLADPLTVVDVGAWLSFGATLGILLLAGPITSRLAPRRSRMVWQSMAVMVAATLAAEVALMPVSAAVFSRVTVAGLILNFAAIPGMAVTQLSGMVAAVLTGVWPWGATLCGGLAHLGVLMVLRSADLLRLAPWMSWQTPTVHWGWTVAYYAAIGVLLTPLHARVLRQVCWAAALSSAAMILWAPPALTRQAATGSLRVTMLDVGQGQAIVVQFPSGESLLVDAGGAPSGFDVGARVVEPALWALGIDRLTWMAITHGDLDHVGGAQSLLRDLRPREIWEGIPVPRDTRLQRLRAQAHAAGVVWRRLSVGQSLEVGSVSVDVLHPSLPDWERQDVRNDDSIVLRVQLGHVGVLLTGDIGRPVEQTIAWDRTQRLRVLTAPHHGSRTSSSAALLDGWLPHAVFVSAGQGNAFGHPAPDVLARYGSLGVPVFRTDRDGAITLNTDGRIVTVSTMSGRRWRLEEAVIAGDRE